MPVALLLLLTTDDNSFWNIGNTGMFAMLAQLSPIVGDSPSMDAGMRRAECRDSGEARMLVLREREDLCSMEKSCVGE